MFLCATKYCLCAWSSYCFCTTLARGLITAAVVLLFLVFSSIHFPWMPPYGLVSYIPCLFILVPGLRVFPSQSGPVWVHRGSSHLLSRLCTWLRFWVSSAVVLPVPLCNRAVVLFFALSPSVHIFLVCSHLRVSGLPVDSVGCQLLSGSPLAFRWPCP